MTVSQLITELLKLPQEAEVFVVASDDAGAEEMTRIVDVSPASSQFYGTAVLLDMEV